MLNELFKNRERSFWLLNIVGWGGYTVAAYLGAITHEKPDTYIAVSIAAGLIGFLLDRLMLGLQRMVSWDKDAVLR